MTNIRYYEVSLGLSLYWTRPNNKMSLYIIINIYLIKDEYKKITQQVSDANQYSNIACMTSC